VPLQMVGDREVVERIHPFRVPPHQRLEPGARRGELPCPDLGRSGAGCADQHAGQWHAAGAHGRILASAGRDEGERREQDEPGGTGRRHGF